MNRALTLAAVLLAGCVKYEEGQAEVGTLACQLHDVCGSLPTLGYDDVDACITDATHQDWLDCPGYSAEIMQKCVDAWQAAVDDEACDVESAPPAVCLQVCGG